MSDTLLCIESLRVDLDTDMGVLQAVRGIDLQVSKGETVCLVGESGCGKSMTALAIMGLLPRRARRTARRMQFKGQDMLAMPEQRMNALRGDRIAMVFQEPMTALNPCLTIGEQLREVLRYHPQARRSGSAQDRALELLHKVGIPSPEQRLRQYVHELSGGLRQRVMIAMALMCGPDLVIADEPTTALDVTIQSQILILLAELRKELDMALLLITHDLGVVARVADRVAVMYAGEIVETAATAQVFATPGHPYTRGLLDCVPVPGRTPREGRLGSIPGTVPSLIGGLAGCAYAPRCPEAEQACGVPGLAEVRISIDPPHQVRCLHAVSADLRPMVKAHEAA